MNDIEKVFKKWAKPQLLAFEKTVKEGICIILVCYLILVLFVGGANWLRIIPATLIIGLFVLMIYGAIVGGIRKYLIFRRMVLEEGEDEAKKHQALFKKIMGGEEV